LQALVGALERARFPYPVAIYPEDVWDLGSVLCADAFDVPEYLVLHAADSLADVLDPIETDPVLLPCAFDENTSRQKRGSLPTATVWYEPRHKRARTR
jgi:hypothetical protein